MTLRSRSFHLPGTAKAAMEVALGENRENHSRTQHVTSSLLFYCCWLDFFFAYVERQIVWVDTFSHFSHPARVVAAILRRSKNGNGRAEVEEFPPTKKKKENKKSWKLFGQQLPSNRMRGHTDLFPPRINQCMFNCAKNKYIKPRFGHRVCVCCFWGFNISIFRSH